MVKRDDVAKYANVSVSTVSRVLNGSKYVSKDLQNRVLDAVEALEYKPNIIAQSLASGNTRHIGVIVEDLKNPFFGCIVEAMGENAYKSGYIVSAFSKNHDLDEVYRNIIQRNLSGVYFAVVVENIKPEHIKIFKEDNIYFVNNPFSQEGPNVYVDIEDSLKKLAELFVKYGHRRIGFIGRHEKGDVWWEILDAHGIKPDKNYFRFVRLFNADTGYGHMKKLLNECPDITGLFCDNDLVALGAIKAFNQSGLEAGRDISIAGCDDTYLAKYSSTPLTTISMPMKEMGVTALNFMLKQIENKSKMDTVCTLKTDLIVRHSVGPVNPRLYKKSILI